MPHWQFRDKRGQASTQKKTKYIGEKFGEDIVASYRAMAGRLLDAHLDALPSPPESTVAAVVLTHELRDNLVRTGIPPRTPDYAPASLWRGETLCLQRLATLADSEIKEQQQVEEPIGSDWKSDAASGAPTAAAATTAAAAAAAQGTRLAEPVNTDQSINEMIVGISWCEHASGDSQHKHVRVDLDLSVICYDTNWARIAQCSYTNLTAPGMLHSGDLTSAPFPKGSRENVRLALDQLPTGTRYVALTILNFTGQPLDECCHDASVFVASTRPGLGPDGLDIISAAALKCKGRNVLGGMLILNSEGDQHFICCDQELLKSATGNNVESTILA